MIVLFVLAYLAATLIACGLAILIYRLGYRLTYGVWL